MRHILCWRSMHSMVPPWDWDPAEVWLQISVCAAISSSLSLIMKNLFLTLLFPVHLIKSWRALTKVLLQNIIERPSLLDKIINMLQHSHIPVNTKSTQTLIRVAKRNQVGFPLVCSCVVGLASVGSRHGSNQVKACLPTEFKGRENKQKDERN